MTRLLAPPPKRPGYLAPPAAAQRLVVAEGTRHRTEIVIGAHRLGIGERSVSLDDIDGVAYSSHRTHANLVQRRIRRSIWVGTRSGALTLDLGARAFGHQDDEREAAVFESLVRILHERVEPRLRRERVTHLCAGGELRLGPLVLAPTGLTVGRHAGQRRWPWRSVPLAELRGNHVALVDGADNGQVHCRIGASVPDAVMLPELLWSASAALI